VSLEPTTFERLGGASITMLPAELVRSMGFPAGDSGLGSIGAPLVYRVREDYRTELGVALAFDGWLMRQTAAWMRAKGILDGFEDTNLTDD